MGYTHYWRRPVGPEDRAKFQALGSDVKRIIEEAKKRQITIAGPSGQGEPEFNERFFAFNGRAPKLDHESFSWNVKVERPAYYDHYGHPADEPLFDFCKTARKPYDAVVTAVLIRAKVIYGDDLWVGSDGWWPDWEEGRSLYFDTFGEEAPMPLMEYAAFSPLETEHS